MVQTNVEEEYLRVVSKTIFADTPPVGRGVRTQDHLEMSTVVVVECCSDVSGFALRLVEHRG